MDPFNFLITAPQDVLHYIIYYWGLWIFLLSNYDENPKKYMTQEFLNHIDNFNIFREWTSI